MILSKLLYFQIIILIFILYFTGSLETTTNHHFCYCVFFLSLTQEKNPINIYYIIWAHLLQVKGPKLEILEL